MKFKHVEFYPTAFGFGAICDGRFAEGLCPDEALGVLASLLFGNKPVYLTDYETWTRRHEHYDGGKPFTPFALLPERTETRPADFDGLHGDRSHVECILCPECKTHQLATVLHTFPWDTYIHNCKCGYTIMESDWQLVCPKRYGGI